MKAIIFNSGLGHRMGDETKTHHKSMTLLKNGETEKAFSLLPETTQAFLKTIQGKEIIERMK